MVYKLLAYQCRNVLLEQAILHSQKVGKACEFLFLFGIKVESSK